MSSPIAESSTRSTDLSVAEKRRRPKSPDRVTSLVTPRRQREGSHAGSVLAYPAGASKLDDQDRVFRGQFHQPHEANTCHAAQPACPRPISFGYDRGNNSRWLAQRTRTGVVL